MVKVASHTWMYGNISPKQSVTFYPSPKLVVLASILQDATSCWQPAIVDLWCEDWFKGRDVRLTCCRIWDVRNLKNMVTHSNDAPPTPPASSPGPEEVSVHFSTEFDSSTVSKYIESKKGKGTLRAEWRHDKSVSSAYWDPQGRQIVSTCYDDTLRCKRKY